MTGSGHSNSAHHHTVEQRTRTGFVVSLLSIVVNILLFALKYWAGIVSGSVAIIADAWHTLSDSFSSIVVFIGFKVSAKPPDRKHPYGHGRAELIAALTVGIILALVGFNFLVESIQRLIDRQTADYGTLAIIAVGASVVLKEILAQVSIRSGRRIGSQALIADGWHHRSDALSSLLVLLGIALAQRFWWTDGILGIVVSGLILYATVEILRDAVSSLLGEEPDEEEIARLVDLCSELTPYDLQIHKPRIHVYGHHRELTFHIGLASELRLSEAHEIGHTLEIAIRDEMGIEATVHIDPMEDLD